MLNPRFCPEDSLEVLHEKYDRSAAGRYFEDEKDYLNQEDYLCLFNKLVCELMMRGYYIPGTRLQDEKTRRLLGIYLREATMRYAQDLAGTGSWGNLEQGVINDYRKIGICDVREGETFWGRTVQHALTCEGDFRTRTGAGVKLLTYIFDAFLDENIKYHQRRNENNDWDGHLLKLAVLPFNYNPVRNRYDELRSLNTKDEIGQFLTNVDRRTLDVHQKTKERLAWRIGQYFTWLRDNWDNRNNQSTSVLKEMLEQRFDFLRIGNNSHFYYDWIEKEKALNYGNEISFTQRTEDFRKEIQFVCKYRRNESLFKYGLRGNDLYDLLKGLNDFNFSDDILIQDLDGNTLLTVRNYGIVFPSESNEWSSFNKNVNRLLGQKRICFVNDEKNVQRNNDWYVGERQYHVLGSAGDARCQFSVNERNYLVVPKDFGNLQNAFFSCERSRSLMKETVDSEGDTLPVLYKNEEASRNSGLDVYEINLPPEYESEVSFLFERGCIEVSVRDAEYLQTPQNFVGSLPFIFQKRAKKIAQGSIEFNIAPDVQIDELKLPTGVCFSKREGKLILENQSQNVCLIQCQIVKINDEQRQLPEIFLLPKNCQVWCTLEGDVYNVFFEGVCLNLAKQWEKTDYENVYQYSKEFDRIANEGIQVEIADSMQCLLKALYFNDELNQESFLNLDNGIQADSSYLGWANNPMNLIPKGADYYYKWCENGENLEVCVSPRQQERATQSCIYYNLGINGAKLEFGWSYKGSRFVQTFPESKNHIPTVRHKKFLSLNPEAKKNYLQEFILQNPDDVLKYYDEHYAGCTFFARPQKYYYASVAELKRDYEDANAEAQNAQANFLKKIRSAYEDFSRIKKYLPRYANLKFTEFCNRLGEASDQIETTVESWVSEDERIYIANQIRKTLCIPLQINIDNDSVFSICRFLKAWKDYKVYADKFADRLKDYFDFNVRNDIASLICLKQEWFEKFVRNEDIESDVLSDNDVIEKLNRAISTIGVASLDLSRCGNVAELLSFIQSKQREREEFVAQMHQKVCEAERKFGEYGSKLRECIGSFDDYANLEMLCARIGDCERELLRLCIEDAKKREPYPGHRLMEDYNSCETIDQVSQTLSSHLSLERTRQCIVQSAQQYGFVRRDQTRLLNFGSDAQLVSKLLDEMIPYFAGLDDHIPNVLSVYRNQCESVDDVIKLHEHNLHIDEYNREYLEEVENRDYANYGICLVENVDISGCYSKQDIDDKIDSYVRANITCLKDSFKQIEPFYWNLVEEDYEDCSTLKELQNVCEQHRQLYAKIKQKFEKLQAEYKKNYGIDIDFDLRRCVSCEILSSEIENIGNNNENIKNAFLKKEEEFRGAEFFDVNIARYISPELGSERVSLEPNDYDDCRTMSDYENVFQEHLNIIKTVIRNKFNLLLKNQRTRQKVSLAEETRLFQMIDSGQIQSPGVLVYLINHTGKIPNP